MKSENKKSLILAAFSVAGLCFIDQLTKNLVMAKMELNESIPVIEGVFQLRYIRNDGAAWSILAGKQIVFIILTPVVVFFLIKMFCSLPNEKKYLPIRVITVFVVSGAIGNLIDRIWYGEKLFQGSVVDFLDFCLIHFPVFNVADIYVSVSVVVFLLLMIFKYKEEDFEVIYDSCIRFGKKKQK